jgi:hypothetical protein
MAGRWSTDEVTALPLESLDQRYRRYRLTFPDAERAMAQSLQRYGQLAPVVVCLREERPVLLDGFKRLDAARRLKGLTALWARRIEVDEPSAKAAIYNLNRLSRRPLELEEAWIVQALVREDGLSQVEAAALLSRHKSWVCRRLAMLERLSTGAREELGLGLLAGLLEPLAKMQAWLAYRGRGELMACDRQPLEAGLRRLAREARVVAEATDDFLQELTPP